MIISLEKAKQIKPNVTQDELNALESFIRDHTHNHFQNRNVRFTIKSIGDPNLLNVNDPYGLRKDDTVEIYGTSLNDGVYTVSELLTDSIRLSDDSALYDETPGSGIVTKVQYPDAVLQGVKDILKYDVETVGRTGIKSKSISRVSETYTDMTKDQTIGGRPAYLYGFLTNYMKMW